MRKGKVSVYKVVTNLETGEITETRPQIREMQFSDERGYLFRFRDNYVRIFSDSPLPSSLSWSEKGKLAELQSYIIGDSQLLGYRSNGKFCPLTIKEIANIFKCKERYAYHTINQAKIKGIIKEIVFDGDTWYSYNPLYGLKNKRLTLHAYVVWQNELCDVIPDWVKKRFSEQCKDNPSIPKVV